MSRYLLTYEDAVKIAERYHNNNFRQFQYNINGYKLVAFDYFICGWNDFENPLPDKPEVNAFDMRGTTFVFDKLGRVWKRFFMLPKFFNVNQVEATLFHNLEKKKLLDAVAKEDGSLVAFMRLPDEEIFAKTIGSFVSDQAKLAMNFIGQEKDRRLFVEVSTMAGFTPLFEYVSGPNRIVLKYSKEDLRFLGLRDNATGEWIPAHATHRVDAIPFNMPEVEKYTSLWRLMERAKTEENKEGWIARFDDGTLAKIKTAWYFNLHGLRTENVFREDYVIKNYFEETLDDLMSQLDPIEDKDAFEFVERVTNAINWYIAHIGESAFKLKEIYDKEYGPEKWHYFAKFHSKEPYFGLARNLIDKPEDYHRRKMEMVLKRTYRLKNAKEIVDKFSNE